MEGEEGGREGGREFEGGREEGKKQGTEIMSAGCKFTQYPIHNIHMHIITPEKK
jgi:hypothetical protein